MLKCENCRKTGTRRHEATYAINVSFGILPCELRNLSLADNWRCVRYIAHSARYIVSSLSLNHLRSIGGSMVECSPATRAARVRFPADATVLWCCNVFRDRNVAKFLMIVRDNLPQTVDYSYLLPSKAILSEKCYLPDGESNPGLPRDRRGYLPLYYRG